MEEREITPNHCWSKCQQIQTFWKIIWILLQKPGSEAPHEPAIAPLGFDSKSQQKTVPPLGSLQHYSQEPKPAKILMSFIQKLSKDTMGQIQWNTPQPQDEIMQFATTWVGLKRIMLSKVSQKEWDRHTLVAFRCGSTVDYERWRGRERVTFS